MSKEIYLSVIDNTNKDESTIWPQSDGTFAELNSWTEYFVNGDPLNKNESKNANVKFASHLVTFSHHLAQIRLT